MASTSTYKYYFEEEIVDEVASKILSSPSMSHETLDENDQVLFTCSSALRQNVVAVEDTVFFVDIEQIRRQSSYLAEKLTRKQMGVSVFVRLSDLSSSAFHTLILAICPSQFGLYQGDITKDNFAVLLEVANRFRIAPLLERCRHFIKKTDLSSIAVDTIISWFDQLFNMEDWVEVSSLLLLSLLSRKDARCSIYTTSSPNSHMFKAMLRRTGDLSHRVRFSNELFGYGCGCSGETQVSSCGLVCTECSERVCGSCSLSLCPLAIQHSLALLIDGSRTSSPDSGYGISPIASPQPECPEYHNEAFLHELPL